MTEHSEAEWEALTQYVTELQTMLHVEHWEIVISREPADDDDVVSAHVSRNNPYVSWRLGATFWEDEPAEQRVHVIHELLHVHLHHAQGDLLESLERHIPPAVWGGRVHGPPPKPRACHRRISSGARGSLPLDRVAGVTGCRITLTM